jgi:hypothetical protein
VPGVCSANCSLVTPRSADAPIVSLEQPAHCASLDDFIKSKEEEANTGTGGVSDTTVLALLSASGHDLPALRQSHRLLLVLDRLLRSRSGHVRRAPAAAERNRVSRDE